MSNSNQRCCICLNNYLNLNELSIIDDNNVTFLKKLQTIVPEIEWLATYHICDPCINLLRIVHTFRETCIKSDTIRKQEKESVNVIKIEPYFIKLEHNVDDSPEDNKIYPDIRDVDDDFVHDLNTLNYGDEDVKDFALDISEGKITPDIAKEEPTQHKRKRKVRKFQCERCPKNYVVSTALVKHCIQDHGMERKSVRPFACIRCTSRFNTSSNLLFHIKYHNAIRSNTCTYCSKGFITKTDLNIHEKQHLNKREYKCETCTKGFNTPRDLRSHKLVLHTDPQLWKYFCEICSQRFPIKLKCDNHMRQHTGDKKFECHLCDKRFMDKFVLQRHLRTHSDIRDFKCSVCRKEYKVKKAMQIHMAKIHGIGVGKIKLPSKEPKYICHICQKAYYAKNRLTRHLYTHSGEKPFFCTICDKNFNDKSYVKRHMKIHDKVVTQNEEK